MHSSQDLMRNLIPKKERTMYFIKLYFQKLLPLLGLLVVVALVDLPFAISQFLGAAAYLFIQAYQDVRDNGY